MMPIAPAPQEFNVDIPAIANLQTGDVLFPRKVARYRSRYDAAYAPGAANPSDDHPRVEGVLHPAQQHSSLSDAIVQLKAVLAKNAGQPPGAGDGLNWSEILAVLKLFTVEFAELVPQWFGGLSAKEMFASIPHPIARLLMEGLSGNRSDGFFIGHSALVVRNNEGAGDDDVYVIEANITDFAHYGVAIHPYFCQSDLGADGMFQYDNPKAGKFPSHKMRGWVNRRVAMGEQVWHQTHGFFNDAAVESALKLQTRQALADCAKPLLGLSYGILDNKDYGTGDRLYCFEFVDYVYTQAKKRLISSGAPLPQTLALDDQRTWDWLRANLKPSSDFQKGFEAAFVKHKNPSLGGASVWDNVRGTKCPVFTAHMLFHSKQLQLVFSPKDKAGLDTDYVQ